MSHFRIRIPSRIRGIKKEKKKYKSKKKKKFLPRKSFRKSLFRSKTDLI